MHLVRTVTALTRPAPSPSGRALSPGGTLDRLLAADGPLFRLVEEGGPVDRLLEEGGALDLLVADGGLLDRLLSDGFVDELVAEGGALDAAWSSGGPGARPHRRLEQLNSLIPELHESVDTLNRSVGPLGDLANRLPRGRRRPGVEV